jgi:ketosteroid isomerase-like protein
MAFLVSRFRICSVAHRRITDKLDPRWDLRNAPCMLHARFRLLMFSLGTFLACAALAETVEPESIRAVLDAQEAAWNRGDIDGFMEGYSRSPKTTFVSGDEVTRGWQTVRDRYAKKYDSREKMGTLTFSDVTITPLCDDAAIVLGSWSLQRKKDRPHGKFTLLFRKLPEGWRIVLDHTS